MFKIGDKVYAPKIWGDDLVTISGMRSTIVMNMYSFVEKDASLGEIYLKYDLEDDDLSISDCVPNQDEVDGRLNSVGAYHKPLGGEETPMDMVKAVSPNLAGTVFFQPNNKMIDWLIEYADGRLIIDVGAGTLHLCKMIKNRGYNKLFAIEPHFDYMKYSQMCLLNDEDRIHVDVHYIEESYMFKSLTLQENMKPLVVFARPCHGEYVYNALNMMPKGTEALYITLPENIDYYEDLGHYKDQSMLLNHEGKSKDGEVVYSIIV
jgi:hypothetical protein